MGAAGKVFYKETLKPTAETLADGIRLIFDEMKQEFAPQTRSGKAMKMAGSLRERAAERDQRRDRAWKILQPLRKSFYQQPAVHGVYGLDVYDAIETWNTAGLTGDDKVFADKAREAFDARFEMLNDRGLLDTYVPDYLPHQYEKPKAARNWLATWRAKRPMAGGEAFRKQRTFPTLKEGLDSGLKPRFDNPVDMVMEKLGEMDQSITAHDVFDEMHDAGDLQFVRFGEKIPDGMAQIDDKLFKVFLPPKGAVTLPSHANIKPEDVTVPGRREAGSYFAPEPMARVANNYLAKGISQKGWYKMGRNINNFLNMLELSMSAYHALTTAFNSSFSDMALGLEQTLDGKPVSGLASFSRGIVPFASVIQDYFKGTAIQKAWDMSPADFQNLSQTDPLTWAITDALKAGGGRGHHEGAYVTNFLTRMKENWGKNNPLLSIIQFTPAMMEQTMKPIMTYMVPRVKLGAFMKLAQQEIERDPALLQDPDRRPELRHVMGQIWDSIDNRFGQLSQQNMMMNATTRDIMNILIGRPGWNIGVVKEYVGGAVDMIRYIQGLRGKGKTRMSHRTAFAIMSIIGTAIFSALMQFLLTRRKPTKMIDFIAFQDGGVLDDGRPSRSIFPTYPSKDLHSYSTRPIDTLIAKASPVVSLAADLVRNRNFYGQKNFYSNPIDDPMGTLNDVGRLAKSRLEPYSFQGLEKNLERGGSITSLVAPFGGILPGGKTMGLSKMENIIANYREENNRSTRPPTTDSSRMQSQIYLAIKRNDEKKAQQLSDEALAKGLLTTRDINRARKIAKMTPTIAGFEAINDINVALKAYDAGTPEERQMIESIARQKVGTAMRTQAPAKWTQRSRELAQKYFGVTVWMPQQESSGIGSPSSIQ